MDVLDGLFDGPLLDADLLVTLRDVADPNRARIVALLRHGEHCVCDVGGDLGMSPALVSHHLRALRSTGLLKERRSGRWIYYSLDLERLAQLRAAVTDLLTPGLTATTTCVASCGARGASRATRRSTPGPVAFETAP